MYEKFRAWLIRVLKLKPKRMYLPIQKTVTHEAYLEACGWMSTKPEGKDYVRYLRERHYEEMGMRCPISCRTHAARSDWLAAHEAVLAVYLQLIDDIVKGANDKPEDEPAKRIKRGA